MGVKFPCSVCKKAVGSRHKAIQCDHCDNWVHIKCNNIDKKTYQKLQNDSTKWFCKICLSELIPFSKLDDIEFEQLQLCTTMKPKHVPTYKTVIEEISDFLEHQENKEISKYYLPDDVNKLEITKTDYSAYLHLNISSLQYHIDDLKNLLTQTSAVNFDIIGISESRLKEKNNITTNIDIDGYVIEHCPTASKAGGALMYISKNIVYDERKDLNIYKKEQLESIFIEIYNNKSVNTIIGCIYKHPCMSINEFNIEIKKLLNQLSSEQKNIILMGDFNIDLLNYDSDSNIAQFLDQLLSNSLYPTISAPTRITNKSKTLIDNIFLNLLNTKLIGGNIYESISDHLPQFLILKKQNKELNTKNHNETMKRNFNKFNEDNFINEISTINWEHILETNKKDPDFSLNQFLNKTNKILDKHAPFEKISQRKVKKKTLPWITKGIKASIRVRNKLQKQHLAAKSKAKKDKIYKTFQAYRTKIISLIRKSKKKYYEDFFKEKRNDLKKTWVGIKEIISNKQQSKHIINCIQNNNKLITKTKEIANTFNDFFVNIPRKIDEKITKTNTSIYRYLKDPNLNSFYLRPTTPDEIQKIIKKMDNQKAVGPNSIPTKILKLVKKEMSIPLSSIVNLSFEMGIFPTKLRIGIVIPVHKRESQLLCNNYRPITLLSNISKIFEKATYQRLYSFLEMNNILYPQQYGFRNFHSTNHALIEITEKIRQAIDQGEFTCGIFLDFQKAFDTVNHEILLQKLRYYGVRGLELNWFKSYLSNRSQTVRIKNKLSDSLISSYGVPQGSILGPLLFLIYINDLNKAVKHSEIHHFADDTNLILRNKSLKKINSQANHDLKLITVWLRANKISLNVNKTKILIFRPERKIITKKLNFRISGQKIHISKEVKYLGIILDEQLKWKKHLQTIQQKLSRANGMLSKIRHFVSKEAIRAIYFSLFHCHLGYGCQIWGQAQNDTFKTIEILQNKALRIINFTKDWRKTADPLYLKSDILKLKDNINLNNCQLAFDFFAESLPKPLQKLLTKMQDIHNHNTRSTNSYQLAVPLVRTNLYGKNSIQFKTVSIWNQTLAKLKINITEKSKSEFTEILKEEFQKAYSSNQ